MEAIVDAAVFACPFEFDETVGRGDAAAAGSEFERGEAEGETLGGEVDGAEADPVEERASLV